jgi:DNA-binding GntR family transcriptional regulator
MTTTQSGHIQKAVEHIRERILCGELQPGFVLSESALAKDLGISRTPVGEALRELAAVGLVEQVPRYGTIVRRVGRAEIIELYEVREALEPHAVALAVGRVALTDVARLGKLCERIAEFEAEMKRAKQERLEGQSLRDFLATDMAFHTVLIHAAGNRRIARIVRDSHVMTQLFGTQRLIHDRRIVGEVRRFHAQILAAVQRGDAEAARDAAAEHIRASLAHTLENLDRQRSGGDLSALALPEDVRAELHRIESVLDRPKRKGKR